MLALLISVIVSAAAVTPCVIYKVGTGETIAAGVVAFIVAQVLTGLVIRKRITKVQEALQEMLLSGRKQMERKVQMFQSKPGGNVKLIQRQLENDQKALITDALAFTDHLEPFKKWSLLMGRQIDTMRMQFLYQLKDFEEVDRILAVRGLFKGPVMMEPMTVAMKMARQYEHGDLEGVEKTFKRRIKWYRGNRGTLLYAVMSWVYMKQGESEKARQLLLKGKDVTADETLARNWEMLSNNKDKHFSNDGLGEEWFGLYLEKPPAPKQQKVRMNARNRRGF
jgi:predicted kinase